MQVICLNILRAMFKDSKFGEDVFPYASDGLMIAIKGFASHIWAVRIKISVFMLAYLCKSITFSAYFVVFLKQMFLSFLLQFLHHLKQWK